LPRRIAYERAMHLWNARFSCALRSSIEFGQQIEERTMDYKIMLTCALSVSKSRNSQSIYWNSSTDQSHHMKLNKNTWRLLFIYARFKLFSLLLLFLIQLSVL
jgi:hypothetical protein